MQKKSVNIMRSIIISEMKDWFFYFGAEKAPIFLKSVFSANCLFSYQSTCMSPHRNTCTISWSPSSPELHNNEVLPKHSPMQTFWITSCHILYISSGNAFCTFLLLVFLYTVRIMRMQWYSISFPEESLRTL